MSTNYINPYGYGMIPYQSPYIPGSANYGYLPQYDDLAKYTGSQTQTTTTTTGGTNLTAEELDAQYQSAMAELDRAAQTPPAQEDGYVAADGKNDGKIGFGLMALNFVKGIGRTFTGMFTGKDGKFSIGQTLKTVGLGALCIGASIVCPGVGTLLLGAGLLTGAGGLIVNGYKAATAQTDQEAEQAWQGLGTSGTIFAMSYAGVKSKGGGSFAEGLKTMKTDLAGAKTMIADGTYGSAVKENIATKIFGKSTWAEFKASDNKLKSAYDNISGKLTDRANYVDKAKKSITDKISELNEARGKDGADIAKIDQEIAQLNKQLKVYTSGSSASNVEARIKVGEESIKLKTERLELKKADLLNATDEAAKTAIKAEIADLETTISNHKSLLSELKNYDAYLNNKVGKMAWQNFKYDHPTKMGQSWALTRPTIGLSKNPYVVTTEAASYLTSPAPSLATYSPEQAAEINQQYMAEIQAQRAQIEQQYQLAKQQLAAQGGGQTATGTGTSQDILTQWTGAYA